ncbi:unnamed protein product [Gongylonema pulchrum]|uniref:FBD domain-containing protein n=1 Tax=Gongylonema pulchrum TaxID=637853 RepID=A0A183EAB4_9BILA|nr:unnamed protein product [Gongylonema pulchrum]
MMWAQATVFIGVTEMGNMRLEAFEFCLFGYGQESKERFQNLLACECDREDEGLDHSKIFALEARCN